MRDAEQVSGFRDTAFGGFQGLPNEVIFIIVVLVALYFFGVFGGRGGGGTPGKVEVNIQTK